MAGPALRGATITGWGTALPERVVSNEELAKTVETSDQWIVARTGIKSRHLGGTTSALATEAARKALHMSGVAKADVDMVVLATITADQQCPASACTVQDELGLDCGAMDVNAACSGFVYALVTAHGLIATGANNVLVLGAETLSSITNWDDRGTCVLFGDGAGAVMLQATNGPGQLLGWDLNSKGHLRRLLYADMGVHLVMEGKEVFRQAVKAMTASGIASLTQAGVCAEDIKLVVPHQANVRIIEASMKRLGIPLERAAVVLDRLGNTSSASIPLALVDAIENDRLEQGDLVLLVGFGAGMTSASAVIRWGAT